MNILRWLIQWIVLTMVLFAVFSFFMYFMFLQNPYPEYGVGIRYFSMGVSFAVVFATNITASQR